MKKKENGVGNAFLRLLRITEMIHFFENANFYVLFGVTTQRKNNEKLGTVTERDGCLKRRGGGLNESDTRNVFFFHQEIGRTCARVRIKIGLT